MSRLILGRLLSSRGRTPEPGQESTETTIQWPNGGSSYIAPRVGITQSDVNTQETIAYALASGPAQTAQWVRAIGVSLDVQRQRPIIATPTDDKGLLK